MTTEDLIRDIALTFGRLPDIIGKPHSENPERAYLIGIFQGGPDLVRDRIQHRDATEIEGYSSVTHARPEVRALREAIVHLEKCKHVGPQA